jgi:capsular exopolysaccharide synthesis family protein
VAVLRRRVDDRIDDPATLRTLVGAPHLGSIRRLSGDAPVMTEHPLSAAAEDVRRLRGSLRHVVSAHRPAVVLVASAGPGEGRTTTALELALGLADTGDRVLLLEADLRRPSLSARLGLPDERGLVSLLAAEATPSEVVAHHASGLDVVAAGPVTAGAPERLSSSRLPAVLTELVAPYDWVLVDSPPLTTAADAGILAPLVSGIVVLARHRRTSARTLRRAVDGLVAVGATLLGTALVGSPAGSSRGDRAGLRALLTRDSRPALPAAADEAVAGLPAGARPEEVRAIEAGSDAGVPDPTTSELDLSAWRVETPAAETSTGSDIPEQAGSETAGAVEAETATVDTEPVEPAASEHVEPEPVEPEPVASSTDPEPEPEPLTGLDEELREELGQPVGVGVPADLVALRTSNGSTPPGTNGTRKRGRGKGR